MDKIDKFLAKLDADRRASLLWVLNRIKAGELTKLQIRKLKGSKFLYRYRQGKIWIVFSRKDGENKIVNIDFRDKVYRDF